MLVLGVGAREWSRAVGFFVVCFEWEAAYEIMGRGWGSGGGA